MGYRTGEALLATPATHRSDDTVGAVPENFFKSHSSNLLLIGGDWANRTAIARNFIAQGWHVAPVDRYDEVDARPAPDTIIACKIETAQDILAITIKMEQQAEWFPIIACIAAGDYALITAAIQAGAQAVLSWPFSPDDLARVMAIAAGGMARHAARHNARSAARSRIANLTKRERDVLFAMIEYGSNKAVANALNLSPRTVEIYRAKTMQRLGAEHLAHALWFAYVADQCLQEG